MTMEPKLTTANDPLGLVVSAIAGVFIPLAVLELWWAEIRVRIVESPKHSLDPSGSFAGSIALDIGIFTSCIRPLHVPDQVVDSMSRCHSTKDFVSHMAPAMDADLHFVYGLLILALICCGFGVPLSLKCIINIWTCGASSQIQLNAAIALVVIASSSALIGGTAFMKDIVYGISDYLEHHNGMDMVLLPGWSTVDRPSVKDLMYLLLYVYNLATFGAAINTFFTQLHQSRDIPEPKVMILSSAQTMYPLGKAAPRDLKDAAPGQLITAHAMSEAARVDIVKSPAMSPQDYGSPLYTNAGYLPERPGEDDGDVPSSCAISEDTSPLLQK